MEVGTLADVTPEQREALAKEAGLKVDQAMNEHMYRHSMCPCGKTRQAHD